MIVATRADIPKARVHGVVAWPPPRRAPLPALPTPTRTQTAAVWADGPYPSTPAYRIPDRPDVDFYRARFNGVVISGIPRSPWNYPNNPELMMTWDLPWLDAGWQEKYLDVYQGEYGLTHVVLSMPQAWNKGFFGDRFLAAAERCARRGLYVCVVLFGGGGDGEISQAEIEAMWARLVAARAAHRVIVCWQADANFDPLPLFDATCWAKRYALEHCPDVRVDLHWLRDAAAWWDAWDSPRDPNTATCYGVFDRRTYYHATGYPEWTSENGQTYLDRICARLGEPYRALGGRAILDSSLLQYDVNAPINKIQEAIVSVWKYLPAGRTKLVAGEYEAQAQSDNDTFPPRDPWCGDTKGYLCQAAEGYGQTLAGFADGGLWPDGTIL